MRFLSLSWPLLVVDAATKHSSSLDAHPLCQPASTSPVPHSSLLQPPPRAAQGRASSQASRSTKENPLEVLGAKCPQDSKTHPYSEQWEFAREEKRLAVNYSCQETLDPGLSIYRVKPNIHMSFWNEGPHPLRITPQYFPWGVAALCKVCWWRALFSPTSWAEQGQEPPPPRPAPCPPLGGWGEAFSP